ncbi:hypothetical protein ACFODO_16005 [Acinetobacter sichuanensis]|uniref:Uncharacterized protein n=1 Tax=Acinetobacter sichuanensis TaxID=2136183 RepID=A0A371YV56_9GAMM|nr:hypothetical protein [Acinetobacter sichuanensis]RFC85360.1 hypothetical protein C9E89_000065 [Acinetobacter sichuanensis]
MEDIRIYIFAQALDNSSSDDWYEYNQNSLEKITEENTQSWVNNLIFEMTDKGEREFFNNVECYYKLNSNELLDLILLIENQQEDNIGRKSKTALIIKGYKNITLEFEQILTLFWTRTNRNLSNADLLAKQCNDILEIIKKKGPNEGGSFH